MKQLLRIFFVSLSLIVLHSCKEKAWDEFYGRPDWLADPIYQQLESRGNFTSFLSLADRTGYKDILSKAGYWTLFAPNDEAFARFLAEQQLERVDQINDSIASAIIKYALVYNAYRKDQLSDYQTAAGILPNMAFKRKTSYYDFVRPGPNGTYRYIVDANGNGTYIANDNNNKYIPYFLDSFMNAMGLSASDYTFFYPDSYYSGFNVAEGKVVNADTYAENGIIHEIDRVILPLPSLDVYLASKPEFSFFKSLLDQFLVSYQANSTITIRHSALTGRADSVYTKLYDASLAFSPNNENHENNQTAPQSNSWTLMVPENEALREYVHGANGILRNFGSFEQAPISVLIDLINAHMWGVPVWPTKFKTTYNAHNELPTFELSNVIDKKLTSNGMFYGVNAVQDANVFRTVYGKVYLDPKYLLMDRAVNGAGIRFSLTNPLLRYTVLMMSDTELRADGYDFNTTTNAWTYTINNITQSGTVPQNNMYRKLQMSVIPSAMSDFSGEGILQTFNEEYIKYRNGQFFAAGNEDDGTSVSIDSMKTAVNGTVIYTRGLLSFSINQIGYHLEKLAGEDPEHFGHFFNYLRNSVSRYDALTKQIMGTVVGNSYTLFVPTNQAIEQAVRNGKLPGNVATGQPDFTPSDPAGIDQVSNFIYYHILDQRTLAVDRVVDDALAYATMYKDSDGNATYLNIVKQVNNLVVLDGSGTRAQVGPERSNNLSNRALIHSIGRVLTY